MVYTSLTVAGLIYFNPSVPVIGRTAVGNQIKKRVGFKIDCAVAPKIVTSAKNVCIYVV